MRKTPEIKTMDFSFVIVLYYELKYEGMEGCRPDAPP